MSGVGRKKTITRCITSVLRHNPLKCSNQLGVFIKSLLSSIFNYSSKKSDYAAMDQIPLSDFPRSPKLFQQHWCIKSFTQSMLQSKHSACLFHWRNNVLSKKKKSVKIEVLAAFSCKRQQRKHSVFPETAVSSFLILYGFYFPQMLSP